ncbi:pentapeptide repeat-containing protein [Roseovarius arcticus]|uniref:pentapeptide repeat-containing protein n=1 Tax=Roseovarius arcticus TaxID=2547404 RepID=UPI0011105BA0|nr:pentapeptide repeat-containing protein [Roseovarius arcticus]
MNTMNRPILGLMIAGMLTLAATYALDAQGLDRSADVKMLGDCEGCVFDKQDFSERKLMGVNLASAQLSNIVFDRAAMNFVIFDGASLRNVSFVGADLSGASFVGSRLIDVTFDGADLKGAVFEGAILERTNLQLARLCNTQIPGDILENSDCR